MKSYIYTVFESLTKKTPSLLFMLREEEFSFIATIPSVLMKIIQTSWKNFPKLHSENQYCIPFFVPYAEWMMYDAYAMQNDVMMLCHEKKVFVPKLHTHIPAIKYIIFFVSALTFRCKLCIPLGTSLELLRLLLSAESALTFRCKLCSPLGTSLEQKTYTAFFLERLFIAS
jgi:hypothetical protein